MVGLQSQVNSLQFQLEQKKEQLRQVRFQLSQLQREKKESDSSGLSKEEIEEAV